MKLPHRALAPRMLVALCVVTQGASAEDYSCMDAVGGITGYAAAQRRLTHLLDRPPSAIKRCGRDNPRWVASWDVFESSAGYRKFATAICFAREPRLRCHSVHHVAAAGTHEVINLRYDIPLASVMGLYETVKGQLPMSEVKSIDYVEVEGGGRWTAEGHGFEVHIMTPPEFSGGEVVRYRMQEGGWAAERPREGRVSSWFGGNTALPAERRLRGDPMIGYLDYWTGTK